MSLIIYFFVFITVSSVIDTTLLSDIITFNVKHNVGYEGFVDERSQKVRLKTPIEASISNKGISASGKICGFHLWSTLNNASFPFIVRQSGNMAILSVKSGADLRHVKREFNFFIQAHDCDPIRHLSTKIPVRLHLIPNEHPVWSKKAYSFKIAEDKPAGTQVGRIQASELGASESSAMCKYEIMIPEDAPFDVDGNGVIYTRKELHVADVSNYILRVRAEDCYKPKPRSSLVSVNIRIVPVCKPGWHGVHSQLNYRAGSGVHAMFDESRLQLVVSCPTRPASDVRAVRVRFALQPGDRNACPRSNGCPLSARERLAPDMPEAAVNGDDDKMRQVAFSASSASEAVHVMAAKALFYLNGDLEPTPSKREVKIETRVEFVSQNGSDTEVALPVSTVVIVLLPRLVPLLHPNIAGALSSASVTVPDMVLAGPGYPVLHDLHLLLKEDRVAGKEEPSVDFCVLRIHPKLTPVAYLEWPKQAVREAKLKALNTSNQFNLKGVASASVYLKILRQVRYHHAYPYALNSSSFVLVCLEHNSPSQDTGDSSMLVLKLRIQHESGTKTTSAASTPANRVVGSLHDPPPAIMHESLPSFEEERPAVGGQRVESAARHHEDVLPAAASGGSSWSNGAVVGFVLGLVFLALGIYLAVMRFRRYRTALLASGMLGHNGSDGGIQSRFGLGGLRADPSDRQGANGLEMEWDNSELNITVNPMDEPFTKYSQVVHYREFSSDDDADDDEDLSSLLSGIPEEGEEESARSCGSGSYGGAAVSLGSAPGGPSGAGDEQDWQWEDDMLPAYTHRPSPLGAASQKV